MHSIVLPGRVFKQYWKYRSLVFLALPGIIFFIIFKYIPIYGVTIAFKSFNFKQGIIGSPWIGFEHFLRLFGSPDFYIILRNTVWISFLKLLFGFPAPIILAILLNEIRSRIFKKTIQTISYLPYFLSWIVISGLLVEMLSPSRGVVNYILSLFDQESVEFLTNPNWFIAILVSSNVWRSIGWGSIIYLASISNIDTQIYEAAVVDGAGRFKQILHITIPSLMPVISIMLILSVGDLLNAGFDQIFNLYNPLVYDVSDIIDTYVYRVGLIDLDYSFATAVNLFKNIIAFGLIILTNELLKKNNEYSIWLGR